MKKQSEYNRKWQKKNKAKVRSYNLAWQKANPARWKEIVREAHLKKKYGISQKDYDNLLIKQNGVCAICKKPPQKRRLCIDHDHKTGRVRGLLCIRCNRAIGVFEDNVELLRNAILYL